MKIFIPTYNRPDTIKTHFYLGDRTDYRILVHNDEQRKLYERNETIDKDKIVVTNTPLGIVHQRNWALQNSQTHEEVLMMDDNIDYFTSIPIEFYDKELDFNQNPYFLRTLFSHKLNIDELIDRINEDLFNFDVNLYGLATVDNYFFRKKKYRFVAFVCGKAFLIRKTSLYYDPRIKTMDDFQMTAEHLAKYGQVLVNNYIFPVAKHNEKGGLGTLEERLPNKQADCKLLMEMYPELFRYANRKNSYPNAEIRLRYHSLEQINLWRKRFTSSM